LHECDSAWSNAVTKEGIVPERNFLPCPSKKINLNGNYVLKYNLDFSTDKIHGWTNVFRVTASNSNASRRTDRQLAVFVHSRLK